MWIVIVACLAYIAGVIVGMRGTLRHIRQQQERHKALYEAELAEARSGCLDLEEIVSRHLSPGWQVPASGAGHHG